MNKKSILKRKILHALEEQGFKYNPHLRPKSKTKQAIRIMHKNSRLEKLRAHSNSLLKTSKIAEEYAISGSEIRPEDIKLELRKVESGTIESKLFLWWNLSWWSIPYERPIGRQMRYFVWDKTHDAPFGLIGLQSPPLQISIRDKYLEIPNNELDYWLNMSLYGQRVGALPPYNDLLGGKMVVMALTSNEIRKDYAKKYGARKTVMEGRKIPAKLLFITTTSAFGRSSMYERVKYQNDTVGEFLGYTSGSSTFYVNEKLFAELLEYLDYLGYDTTRGYGTGPSRKLKLFNTVLSKLGLWNIQKSGIKRGFYLFSNTKNLKQIIKENRRPRWHDRPFKDMQEFWLERYAIPRSERKQDFKKFDFKKYSRSLAKTIG